MYKNGLAHVGPSPSWSRDWRKVGIYGVAVYLVVLSFRLSFFGRWDHPELWVAGERILATHDAYYWLAKAKGLGTLSGYALAEFAALVHGVTGLGLGTIGFWSPAVVTALVGVVCFLWGWLIGGRSAGVLAGLVGSLTPGFFYRTRLGYFDTDMFTLLMPMLVAFLLAYWAGGLMRGGWFCCDEEQASRSVGRTLWMALGFGLATRFACIWHNDILNIAILYFFMTIVVVMVNGRPGMRATALQGLAIFALAAFPGGFFGQLSLWPVLLMPLNAMGLPPVLAIILTSLALALGLLYLWMYTDRHRPGSFAGSVWCAAAVLVLVVFATRLFDVSVLYSLQKMISYLTGAAGIIDIAPGGATADGAAVMGPVYPSVLQSIIEVRLEPLSVILERGAFVPWLGWLAALCSVVVVILRPAAIFLLPLVALQFASVKLGVRFSMFGGAALCVMLGVGIYWLAGLATRHLGRKALADLGLQVALGVAMLVYCHVQYATLPLTPVLSRYHAEALVELGKESDPKAMVWTWWDWGYAAQYFAGLETVADGGKHAGRDLYPLGFAMASPSPERARSMMLLSAQYPDTTGSIGLAPAAQWDTIPRRSVVETLERQLEQPEYPAVPPQYFVVSWNDLTLAKWITHFGNWNLETGTTREATVSIFEPGELGFNVERGGVMDRKGGGGLVRDITVLDRDGVNRKTYPMNAFSPQLLPKTQHLIINMISKQSVVLDKTGNEATMTKLLTGDPDDPEIATNFRLVVDRLPFVRIYEVVQSSE
jgi:dolichyl-diphosphooligosaccharide--protein glycosyltransferase